MVLRAVAYFSSGCCEPQSNRRARTRGFQRYHLTDRNCLVHTFLIRDSHLFRFVGVRNNLRRNICVCVCVCVRCEWLSLHWSNWYHKNNLHAHKSIVLRRTCNRIESGILRFIGIYRRNCYSARVFPPPISRRVLLASIRFRSEPQRWVYGVLAHWPQLIGDIAAIVLRMKMSCLQSQFNLYWLTHKSERFMFNANAPWDVSFAECVCVCRHWAWIDALHR